MAKITRTFVLFLAFTSICQAAPTHANLEEARYHIQNLYNELDLLIRNQHSDKADLKKQEREFEAFHLFERIPFQRDVRGLKKDLSDSAQENGLEVKGFHSWKAALQAPPPVPRSVYTNNPHFKLTDDQLTETIPFSIAVKGDPKNIEDWVSAWPEQVLRLVKSVKKPTQSQTHGTWLVEGIAYRFRAVQFPRLVPRNPMSLVPVSEKASLARNDPSLWQLTRKIEALRPQTPALYANRGRFLLDGARMEFLLRRLNGSR